MSFARIQPITDKLSCKPGESVECSFDVINTSDRTIRFGLEPMGELADAGQVAIKGSSEIELQANGQEKVLVTITAPADPAGSGKPGSFSLRVYNVRDTEQTVESKSVAVEVSVPKDAKVDVETTTGPNWGLIIGGIVGGLVLLVGGGVGIYLLASGGGVPDVVDMTVEEAIETLEEEGLSAVINETADPDVEADPGIIVSQDPSAGEDAPDSGEVTLVMVQAAIEAPRLIGMTVPAAVETLKAAGLDVGEKTFERGGQYPGGAVTAQSVEPGDRVLPGQNIDLTVEQEVVGVPEVAGMQYATALEVLSSSGLVAGETTRGRGEGVPGSVIDQEPKGGTEAERGSVVDLTVKEKTVSMPNLKGSSVESAVARLTRDGLRVQNVSYTTTRNRNAANKVSDHTPGPGAEAYIGSDVQLKVARMRGLTLPSVTYFPSENASVVTALTNQMTCANAIQGKIAWDYKGSKTWAARNIANLCKGAERSTAPAECFNTVLHGGVNYGGGTRWAWQNAINLCKGTTNANSSVQCFKSKIAAGISWQQAIPQCNRTLYKPGIAYTRNLQED